MLKAKDAVVVLPPTFHPTLSLRDLQNLAQRLSTFHPPPSVEKSLIRSKKAYRKGLYNLANVQERQARMDLQQGLANFLARSPNFFLGWLDDVNEAGHDPKAAARLKRETMDYMRLVQLPLVPSYPSLSHRVEECEKLRRSFNQILPYAQRPRK